MSSPDMLPPGDMSLLGDPEPGHWAERFVFRVTQHPQVALDVQVMTVWFSAAIMTGEHKQLTDLSEEFTDVCRRARACTILLAVNAGILLVNFIHLFFPGLL